jgi:autotransporter-associated beta strand protein
VNGIQFNAGASPFTITVSPPFRLNISGVGITNNSGIAQNFATTGSQLPPVIVFTNSATAGSGTFFTNGGVVRFYDASTAGNGTFTINGGAVSGAGGGFTGFLNHSSAGNGTFTINGGAVSGAFGGSTDFLDHSSAGNGIFTVNGGAASGADGGSTDFFEHSSAGDATLIANGNTGGTGGKILFQPPADGGRSRVKIFGNGNLDISLRFGIFGVVTVGSIEGDGRIFLGVDNLTVGSNNLDTVFSGMISDHGGVQRGTGGSLTKIGTGKLVLSHGNIYTGGTTVKRGKLIINNVGCSGTGSGPVHVDAGTLAGKGVIAGAVTVGTGSGRGATLSPGYLHGAGSPGALTIQSALTFNSDATYKVGLNSSNTTADEVVANGVTINGGAQFSFSDLGSGTLAAGTVFTVINNTSASPIAGAFSNLANGSVFASNGNNFKASYTGGTGNDLTLTVVP